MSDYQTLTQDTASLRLRKQLVRGITGDRESVIEEFSNPNPELLEQAARIARQQGNQFLTIQIGPDQTDLRDLLLSRRFQLESHQITVPTANWPAPEGSPYSVRPLQPGDDFSIGVLNATMLEHTLCAGREYDLGELSMLSMQATMEQAQRTDAGAAGLMLMLKRAQVGHLLLDLNPESGYIVDLAVVREHWGGRATQHLMRAGSQLLFQRGIPLMIGDVSANNRRALMYATRFLGFKVTQERYGLKL